LGRIAGGLVDEESLSRGEEESFGGVAAWVPLVVFIAAGFGVVVGQMSRGRRQSGKCYSSPV
jgi:hypothetical protein